MLPKNVSDPEVSALFSQYGVIKDLQILRGSQQTSKGILGIISLKINGFVREDLIYLLHYLLS